MSPSAKAAKPSTIRLLRNRLIAGLFVVLPFVITWLVVKWLYDTIISVIIGPVANLLIDIWSPEEIANGEDPSTWLTSFLASLAALILVLGVLFIAGMFFRSRTHRLADWFFSTVPGVNTVYSAVSNVFEAISSSQSNEERFKRVVLVQFPHPGTKVPAFVTSECTDINTGRKILCIYVPTTPVPTSGYMLLVPEDEVVEVNWDLQEALQAIVSGGITVPKDVIYDQPKITISPIESVPGEEKPAESQPAPDET